MTKLPWIRTNRKREWITDDVILEHEVESLFRELKREFPTITCLAPTVFSRMSPYPSWKFFIVFDNDADEAEFILKNN